MLPKSNIHSHTNYADGLNTADEMAQAALRLGWHTLGFSEHAHADYDVGSMAVDQEPQYRAEIRRLARTYAGRIHILLGCEHDWWSPTRFEEYDYAIESVHYLRAGGEYLGVDHTRDILTDGINRLFSGDPYAMCREYFRTVCASIEGTCAQVLGHIELVMKFNERRDLFDDADPRYLDCALETAGLASRSGRLVEINTGAIARGYRTLPYPGAAMLRRIAECGGRIMLTSDCHDAARLDAGFADAAALAKACGFRTAWEYRGMEPVEYLL